MLFRAGLRRSVGRQNRKSMVFFLFACLLEMGMVEKGGKQFLLQFKIGRINRCSDVAMHGGKN